MLMEEKRSSSMTGFYVMSPAGTLHVNLNTGGFYCFKCSAKFFMLMKIVPFERESELGFIGNSA